MVVVSGSGTGGPTPYGKREMALDHYRRGCHFVGAAILLNQKNGDRYVVLHLLCQGLEIILKALLLLRNFDVYLPKVKNYRNRVVRIAHHATTEFKLRPLRDPLLKELSELGNMYEAHAMRYSLLHGMFIDPKSIPYALVMKRTGAVIRLAEREMTKAFGHPQ